ncbi:DUF1254 domain-containing protein [Streptacidiphilus sp. ASG 303]|uniref:DUF1254 domain-containing protein n=1 Tax=Streptacidiphilus sp. ASG 303 TaxID=2896847 RepID=UPI001E381A8A|nr:DUF1254 domain-containing protein [Streptacidiphilus sp. ASG 303]MCD0482397.1 DUF1254 domain-containing protein [Streptacidiphilus sp. ASG 303]
MASTATDNRPAQRLRHDLADVASGIVQAATATGRATAAAVRHPGAAVGRARQVTRSVPAAWRAAKPSLTGRVDDWRHEYAYALGQEAFVYGFPYIYNARLRHRWVTQEPESEMSPHAPVNVFWHADKLWDASDRQGLSPNNDTLYSWAWVDLGAEPVVLAHPDMGDRYFTFELVAFTSDNYDYVGRRATGPEAGAFALVGPGWTGELPEGVRRTATAPTPWVLIAGRTLVEGEDDLPRVHALQRQYTLTPLHLYGRRRVTLPERRDVAEPVDAARDPLGPWKTLNAMLAENPPPPHHDLLLRQFAEIGVGPGLDVEAQPEPVKQGLVRAAATGLSMLEQQLLSGQWATLVNGWRYPPPQMGHFGDDFLRRAAEQSLVGIAANDPEEAVYLAAFDDSDGRTLTTGRYRLRFGAGELPPVDAFWSLTAYDEDRNLIPNPIDRYSVGDRTQGLVTDTDGGLTLYLQPDSPGRERESNWLPTPKQGIWYVGLRMYLPHPEVVDARWHCPPITRVG